MSERFRDSIRTFRRHAPAIETGTGAIGLIGMAGVAVDPKAAREASQSSPVGIDTVASAGNELGLSDQAVFTVVTIFFGLATIHGSSRLRRQRNSGSS